ncbi:MAG: UvrB/UvrC motif-containing protein, partial [Dissulfurimicrobium sp.]
MEYNKTHGITPLTISKTARDALSSMYEYERRNTDLTKDGVFGCIDGGINLEARIKALEKEMKAAAKALDFERAARIRDEIKGLKGLTG